MSDNKKRSISLSPKLNTDLETLCDHLGVNVHSYVVNELAKSVQRDSLQLNVVSTTNERLEHMLNTIK